MTVCEFCGFDSEVDSLVAEGVPCGIANCYVRTCCIKSWEKHKKECHKNDT